MPRSPLPLALLATLVLASGAEAATIPTTHYAVTIEGTASYNRADIDDGTSAQHDLDIAFGTEIPRLTFYGDAAEDSRGARGAASVTRGSYVITGDTGVQVRCRDHTVDSVAAGGLDASPGQGATIFATRVIDTVAMTVTGCDSVMPAWPLEFGSGGDPVGVGIFDSTFTFPHDQIGVGVLEVPLSGEIVGAGCPFNHFNTVFCSLTWEATVRFTKTGTGEDVVEDEDLEVPLTPAPPAPAPAPPAPTPTPTPAPPVTDDDLLVPLVPVKPAVTAMKAKASLARDLGRASLPLRCVAACRGTVTATAAGRTLARVPFRATAGRTVTTRMRFDAADRRAIRRAGGVRLAVRATTGGRTVRSTTTLRRRR